MRKLLQVNVLVAGGAASIALAAPVLVGRHASWIGAAIAFALAFAVYNFDRLVDSSSAEGSSAPERAATMREIRRWMVWLIPTLLLGALGAAAAHGLRPLAWSLAFPALGIAYALPVLPHGRRPKDVPYLKCFYTAGCWTLFAGLGLSLTAEGISALALPFFLYIFVRIFVATYLGDLRDVRDDAASGLKSFANTLSPAASQRLLDGLHLASALAVVALVVGDAMPVGGLGLLLPTAVGFAFFRLSRRFLEHEELLLELYDLEMVLYAPSVVVVSQALG